MPATRNTTSIQLASTVAAQIPTTAALETSRGYPTLRSLPLATLGF